MDLVIMGLITGLNFILIYIKFNIGRLADAALDLTAFAVICTLFSTAGQGGLFVGMLASFVVSVYLWFKPPAFKGIA